MNLTYTIDDHRLLRPMTGAEALIIAELLLEALNHPDKVNTDQCRDI